MWLDLALYVVRHQECKCCKVSALEGILYFSISQWLCLCTVCVCLCVGVFFQALKNFWLLKFEMASPNNQPTAVLLSNILNEIYNIFIFIFLYLTVLSACLMSLLKKVILLISTHLLALPYHTTSTNQKLKEQSQTLLSLRREVKLQLSKLLFKPCHRAAEPIRKDALTHGHAK